MKISNTLQIGKAAEHLVCCDLILQGYSAFLADQGLPYDILVDVNGLILRCQVKSTLAEARRWNDNNAHAYRFQMKRPNHCARRTVPVSSLDLLAFVALNVRRIAYFTAEELRGKEDNLITILDLKSIDYPHEGRKYPSGHRRKSFGRFLEEYKDADRCLNQLH